METKFLSQADLQEAVDLLNSGELVAFPTETVYGLGADATNEIAVKKVYQAKGRPSDNPLIVTVSDEAMMREYANQVTSDAKKLIDQYWPGPLTILLPVKNNSLPSAVTGGLSTVAFRNPADNLTRELIAKLQKPIVGPSANTSTKPSPTTANHVKHDLDGKIAAIMDNGPTKVGLESTIIDLTVDPYVVLRPGQISASELADFLGKEVQINQGKISTDTIPKAPGMKYRHYAPSAQVIIVDNENDFTEITDADDIAVVALDQVLQDNSFRNYFSLGTDIVSASHNLFDALRFFDNQKEIKTIYVQGFKNGDLAPAYMNRLEKSAAGKHFA